MDLFDVQDPPRLDRYIDPSGRLPSDDDYDPFASPGDCRAIAIGSSPDGSIPDIAGARESFTKPVKEKVKFVKDSAQYARAIKLASALYPGALWQRCEWKITINGVMVTRDLWGFADILGVRSCEADLWEKMPDGSFRAVEVWGCQDIAIQLTTLDQVGPHIRKYVSDAKSSDEMTTEAKLRHFLRCGNVFLILGGYKEGNRWQFKRTVVDKKMLDAAIARKRK